MGQIWHLVLLHWVIGIYDADDLEKGKVHGAAYGERVYSKWFNIWGTGHLQSD